MKLRFLSIPLLALLAPGSLLASDSAEVKSCKERASIKYNLKMMNIEADEIAGTASYSDIFERKSETHESYLEELEDCED